MILSSSTAKRCACSSTSATCGRSAAMRGRRSPHLRVSGSCSSSWEGRGELGSQGARHHARANHPARCPDRASLARHLTRFGSSCAPEIRAISGSRRAEVNKHSPGLAGAPNGCWGRRRDRPRLTSGRALGRAIGENGTRPIRNPRPQIALLAGTAGPPKSPTLTLLLVGLYFSVAPPALADGPAPLKPSVEANRDLWLNGPELRVYPVDGNLRPFVVGGAGRMSETTRLGIEDTTNRFRDAPYAGRAGGGLELRLGERSSFSVEGSYLQPGGAIDDAGAGTAALELEIRF